MSSAPSEIRTPTIRDVAAEAGVSVATVSYALNGGGRLADSTRAMVRSVAERLGYRPSPVALALKGVKAKVAAMVMDGMGHPFFASIMAGAQDALEEAGFGMIAASAVGSGRETARRLAEDSLVSGFMVMNPDAMGLDFIRRLAEKAPVVLYDAGEEASFCPRFGVRNAEAMAALAGHLIGLGYRDFAYLDGNPSSHDARERLAAFKATIESAGIRLQPGNILRGGFRAEPAEEAVSRFLDAGKRPRALVSANDEMAFGAMRAILARGLRIPEDIAVTGFDDVDAAAWTHPALTTAGFDREGLGRLMGRRLLAEISRSDREVPASDGAEPEPPVTVPAALVVRQSCGARAPR